MVKKFSIILDDLLFEKVEVARGEKPRTEYIKEVIEDYLTQESPNDNPASSTKVIEFLQGEIVFLRSQLSELDRLLSQEQSLHLQTQKQIMPGPGEITKKAWWHFWK